VYEVTVVWSVRQSLSPQTGFFVVGTKTHIESPLAVVAQVLDCHLPSVPQVSTAVPSVLQRWSPGEQSVWHAAAVVALDLQVAGASHL
jgi:hypothetical protein